MKFWSGLSLLLLTFSSQGQYSSYTLEAEQGFLFLHSQDVAPIGQSYPRALSLSYSRWLLDSHLADRAWPVDAMATHIYPLVGENYPEFADYYDAARDAVMQRGGPHHMWITESTFDLGGPVMDDAKAQNILRKVLEKHKGFVFWYAYDRPDLGGMSALFEPGTLAWSELELYRN